MSRPPWLSQQALACYSGPALVGRRGFFPARPEGREGHIEGPHLLERRRAFGGQPAEDGLLSFHHAIVFGCCVVAWACVLRAFLGPMS
eukprot:9504483-Lingulodinium_polyedra.AAC.1